ncbi:MAG: response regulator [Treponema sp.]|nr:response regulator [Treponema sp.]
MKKRLIFVVNICIILGIIVFSLLYLSQSRKAFAKSKTMSFLAMVKGIAQISSNYMNGEQLACDTWGNYISKSSISIEEAMDFLRMSIARRHSTAHIIFIDDGSMEGLSSDPHTDNKNDFTVSYKGTDIFPSLETRNDGLKVNITRAFTNPVNGKKSIAFYNRISVMKDGQKRAALLLRIVPLETLRNSWVFPTESYKNSEVSLIDSNGDYIIKGSSFKNSNFFEFYKSYNSPDYNMQTSFQEGITGENSTTTMRNSKGEDWLIAHAAVSSSSGWIIVSSLPLAELEDSSTDFILTIIIACGLILLIAFNLVTMMMFNRQLSLTAKAEKAANKAKSDFLSVMSHDIRTPINAVLGLDEMILRESRSSTIQGYASDIQSSGKMLLGLINDILDFSKIEAGKMEIVTADYDEGDVMSDLVNIISPRAQAKGLSFVVDVNQAMPCLLRGDDTRIKQCTLNLLTNAVKYTHSGSVTLTLDYEKVDDSHILIKTQVKDTGIGIKQEDLTKLCSPYERIEESRNRNIEGTGLGMSIVTKLLAAMGSSLSVKSEYGKGSEFAFDVIQEVRDWKELGDWKVHHDSVHRSAKQYRESFQAPEARILIVDDTPMNLTVVKALLKATRIQMETAADAMTALKKAGRTKFDIILADHLMPQMGGLEMLQKLRADSTSVNQNTVCIALTANAVNGAREMYLEAGFADYVTKPIDAAKLEATLEKFLPEKLILHEGDEGFETVTAKCDGSGETHEADALVRELFGIDSGEALRNCGGSATFLEALKAFYSAIAENANRIEGFAAGGDWNNYTILVHSLKSSARLIGAVELSEAAKNLEAKGNAARSGDGEAEKSIMELTPALLEHYRSYQDMLAPLCGAARTGNLGVVESPSDMSKQEPDAELLSGAMAAIRKALEESKMDYASEILMELDSYALSPEFKDWSDKLKAFVDSGDREAAMRLV